MNINCFVTGILDRLNYIVNVGSQTIYIYSMYENNDNDHNVVKNHTKIASMLGTMDDFDMFLTKLQEKKSMYLSINILILIMISLFVTKSALN